MNHLAHLAQEVGGVHPQIHRCLSSPEFLLVPTPPPTDYVQIQGDSTVADSEV